MKLSRSQFHLDSTPVSLLRVVSIPTYYRARSHPRGDLLTTDVRAWGIQPHGSAVAALHWLQCNLRTSFFLLSCVDNGVGIWLEVLFSSESNFCECFQKWILDHPKRKRPLALDRVSRTFPLHPPWDNERHTVPVAKSSWISYYRGKKGSCWNIKKKPAKCPFECIRHPNTMYASLLNLSRIATIFQLIHASCTCKFDVNIMMRALFIIHRSGSPRSGIT